MKKKTNRYYTIVSIIVIFICGLLIYELNYLTTFKSDDFNYHYSFADGTRIKHLSEVVTSQIAHYKIMNGRIPAHFLMQVFTIYGKPVFNVANTLVYLFFIWIVLYMIKKSWKINSFSYLVVFIVFWYYAPAFGSTVLWMDGSFNYLWTTVIVLIAMLPFRNAKLYDYKLNQFIFPIIALIAGWCSETTSAGLVFFQFWIIVYCIYRKKKHVIPYIITMLMSFAGYCLMTFSPGQLRRLSSVSGGDITIFKNIYDFTVAITNRYFLELIFFILLLSIAMFLKRDKATNNMAILFFATSILSSCTLIMTGMKGINDRTYFGINTLIVIALGMLIANIFKEHFYSFQKMCLIYFVVLVPLFLLSYSQTFIDLVRTHKEYNEREVYIQELKDKGEKELTLKAIISQNDHSPYYGIYDLSANVNHWQNVTKSIYYGVDKIYKAE